MTISSAILTTSRDRQFADWGQTITFRYFDASETQIDTSLTAIPGASLSKPPAERATRELSDEATFLIKSEELPTGSPTTNSRVVYSGTEYEIVSFDLSADGLIYTLSCRTTT